uniref:PDZ domain-containing protein n=1 Tax=Noctiluca scintillans TaxID=2966 RepID=A0A7S1A9I5_NOCSC
MSPMFPLISCCCKCTHDESSMVKVDSKAVARPKISHDEVALADRSPKVVEAWKDRDESPERSGTEDREWNVRLSMPDGLRSGLGVARRRDLGVLVVRLVVVPGAADNWNTEHPNETILPGDHIIEVNGKGGNVSEMAAEVCRKMDYFDIKLRRPSKSD